MQRARRGVKKSGLGRDFAAAAAAASTPALRDEEVAAARSSWRYVEWVYAYCAIAEEETMIHLWTTAQVSNKNKKDFAPKKWILL